MALDKDDVGGEQHLLPVCVASRIPDNTHACDDSKLPPRAVIALTWDANADLDLQVVGPGGRLIDAKHPTSAPPDETMPDVVGSIDRDSNANCIIDGVRAESLVWNDIKPHGRYGIYVNMADACKQPAARFKVEVFTAVSTKSGDVVLKRFYEQGGELLDVSANGDAKLGLFVSEFVFK